MSDAVDVVIVGAGASGAAAAWQLSREPGLRVLCLEQGGQTRPQHYPATRPDWELSRQGQASPDPNQRGAAADYPIDNHNSPISLANFNGVGGSTILYSGHFPRFHPSDFRTRQIDGVGADWPLTYAELLPHFRTNEAIMGVAGLGGDPAYPDESPWLPPVPLGPLGRRVGQACNALGWHWWPSYSAISTHQRSGRAACINLGPCNTGCAQGAKGSVDVTYWPQALHQGVELRTDCQVFDIPLSPRGRARGVRYLDRQGRAHFQPAAAVLLAGSGAGTPRLLLQCTSSAFPDGLLNEQGLVGRNLMLHPLAYTEALFDEDLRSSIGPQGCCLLSQQFYETAPDRDFVRGYTLQLLRGAPPVETAVGGLLSRRIPFGPDHHAEFSRYFNRTAGVAAICEDLPEPGNRITLDDSRQDGFGLPGLKIHYQLGDNTRAMLKHAMQTSRSLFEAAGARVLSSRAPVRQAGWHIMGTARMGRDPQSSVVNPHGQAHAVSNLFIADSSVFVTAGAVNPVATAQAISLKIAAGLPERLRAAC